MRSIRTTAELSQLLDDDFSVRKRELTTLKNMVSKARQHEEELFVRAAICILYSHWEGFIKNAATSYICYVVSRGLRLRDLAPNFLTLGLISGIQQLEQSKFVTIHAQITKGLTSEMSEKFSVDCEKIVDARSNLNSTVLDEILQYVGVEPSLYQTKNLMLDERLLGNRNRIAHGDNFPLDIELSDYIQLHETIVELLQQFRTDLENAAELGKYRKHSTSV